MTGSNISAGDRGGVDESALNYYGIEFTGADTMVTNRGLITNVDPDLDLAVPANREFHGTGIVSKSNSNARAPVIVNDGTIIIKSHGRAQGIRLEGIPNGSATITNSGTIDVDGAIDRGPPVDGILVRGTPETKPVTVYNHGTITVRSKSGNLKPTNGIGVFPGNDVMITNSGTITVHNRNAVGINVGSSVLGSDVPPYTGENTDITSSGRVRVFGENAVGIQVRGNDGVITLSGLVESRV